MASGTENSSAPLTRFQRYRQQHIPHFSKPKHPHDWHWFVAGIGKALIVVGLLMFAFVGYQLWGTGIQTAQAQNRLEDQFRDKLESTTTVVTTTPTTQTTIVTDPSTVPGEVTTTTVPTAAPSEPIPEGDAIAILKIPKIGITWRVVEGVSVADLKDGPGHFRETVMPGQLGNAAIAGHRTTHGHPFLELDQLKPGDLIEITTLVGTYTYVVTGSVVVKPSDYALVIPTVDPTVATLVLATCDPAYTARNRLVVRATLVVESSDQVYAPAPTSVPVDTTVDTIPGEVTSTSVGATPDTVPTSIDSGSSEGITEDAFSDGWFSDSAAFPHVVGWGLLLIAVGFGAYFAGRAAKRLYVCFLVGFVPFVIVLYFWFENVNRLLPPGL